MATTSQNGWPIVHADALDTRPLVAGVKFPQGVLAGDVATVLGYVAGWIHHNVEPLKTPGCWGYDLRKVTGGSSWSNHSSGTAIDINAPKHPLGKTGTWTPAQETKIHAMLHNLGGVIRWGGDYKGRKDEMHFEIVGTHEQVHVLANKLTGAPAPQHPEVAVMVKLPELRRGSKDVAGVHSIQVLGTYRDAGANVKVDGDFGPATEALVKRVQKAHKLKTDGIVGTLTWGALLGKPQ